MISHTTKRFRKLLAALPAQVRKQAREAYRIWSADPWHPSLHFKQIHPTLPVFSARVGLDWRAVGVRKGDSMIWDFIGSHADYERLIATL